MLTLFLLGLVFFPFAHVLCTSLLKCIFQNVSYGTRFSISTRIVSCIQAIIATSIGVRVIIICNDIMKERFTSVIGYAYFGLSYFYYDLVVMFLGAYFKAQSQDPNVSIMTVWKKFHQQKTLIIYHHLLLPVVAFPLTVWSTYFRKDLGDFFIGCLYTVEISTPFLSLKVILEKLGKRGTLLYIINGLCLATFFFLCRILLFPYLYWRYSVTTEVPFLLVPMKIPFKCNLGCLVLLLPQIYWFYMIVKGVFKYLSMSWTKVDKKSVVANGGSHANHFVTHDNSSSAIAHEKEI